MRMKPSLDLLVKSRLKRWGQRPPGMQPRRGKESWLRGRPSEDEPRISSPFLKMPGSTRLRTLPDGLWLNFGGCFAEPFVDILAIEACSTIQNLLDKRARFAPSTHSMMCVCPIEWLLASVTAEDATPRWRTTGVMLREPFNDAVMPVREMRVLYGLKSDHYRGFARHQIPHAHEFFVPIETLAAENSEDNPALRALIARSSVSANFFSP
ncbi:MAG: hypothetical protein QOH05_2114 [Acetobacteraceae bacterium]|nr:hypothetical protein [Acetobacteraceae bacterium]